MKKYMLIILMIAVLGMVVVGCFQPKPIAVSNITQTTATSPKTIVVGPDEAACPVLGTVMKKADMTPMQHNGKTYYVCCQECQVQFKADPDKYIKNPAPLTREMSH